MSRLRSLRSLIPLLAVLFALAGIAGARAGAERVGSPSILALCLSSAGTGGELPDGGHDCLDCCLPTIATTVSPAPLPTLWSSVAMVLGAQGADFALHGFGLPAPLSRGPPDQASA